MSLQNCKKIIFGFVFTLGLLLIPRVSFARDIILNGYNYPLSTIIGNDNRYYIILTDKPNSGISYIIFNETNSNSHVSVYWSDPYLGLSSSNYGGSIRVVSLITGNINYGNISNNESYNTTGFNSIYTNIPINLFSSSVASKIKGEFPVESYYLHIIGNFSNATSNIVNGSEITENIVVTSDDNYYFTNVQQGFVLSNNDTVATYDISELSGDFNLVATDFTTALIGSTDPDEPPEEPPTDDPIIIGDIEFTDTTPVGNWFSSLFSSAIDLFERSVPLILGVFGLYFAINWLISLLKKS